MHGDIRDDWKIRDIEQKADRATSRLYELDSLRSDLDRIQHSDRETRAMVDELRYELETCKERIAELERSNGIEL